MIRSDGDACRLGRVALVAALLLAPLLGAGAERAVPASPAKLLPRIQVFAAEPVRDVWPELGPTVNALPPRDVLVPGQGLAIGVFGAGDGRDALLRGTTFTFRIRVDGQVTPVTARGPAVVKAIKAEGGDFVLHLLEASGIGGQDLARAKAAVTQVSLAAIVPAWTCPDVQRRREVVVEGEAVQPDGATLALAPARLAADTWTGAAAERRFDGEGAEQQWMNGYALRPEPQHLPTVIRRGAASGAHALAVLGFPSYAIEAAPAGVVPFLVEALRKDDERTRFVGALALRWAGKDAAPLVATLPEELRRRFEAFPARPGGYALDLAPEALGATSNKMDLLWGEFCATGRAAPIRAIAELLRLRDDYPPLAAALRTPDVKKELSPSLARGTLYMTAGWSLSSFVRGGGLAADHVARWKEDPATPPVLREELEKLLVNEAFRPPKGG